MAVLSMAVPTTMPSRVLRRLRSVVSFSAIALLERLGGADLSGPQLGHEPRDLPAPVLQRRAVVQLPGDVREAEVEQLLAGVVEVLDQVGVAELADLGGLHQKAS